jgi:hypothetical protein
MTTVLSKQKKKRLLFLKVNEAKDKGGFEQGKYDIIFGALGRCGR